MKYERANAMGGVDKINITLDNNYVSVGRNE